MCDEAQRVHLVAVEQHIDLHQLAAAVAGKLVVKRGVALGVGLERVEEIVDDLVERHFVVQLDEVGIKVLHILELAAAFLTHRHNVADVVGRRDDGDLDVGLLRVLDHARVGVVVWIVHAHHRAVGLVDLINNARQRGDEVEVKFALKPLLNDLHVQHPEEAAAEAEAEGDGAFRLEGQAGVVELELFQRVTQVGVLAAVLGVDAAVDHRAHLAVAGQRLARGVLRAGHGVADLRFVDVLDAGGEVADLTGLELLRRLQPQRAHQAAFEHLEGRAGRHHFDLHAGPDGAVLEAHIDDHAAVGVIIAVEDQRLERGVRVALGCGEVVDDVLKHRVDVDAELGGDLRRVLGGDGKDILDLLLHTLGIGGRQVDLVDDGADLQIVLHRKIGVGERLRLDAL